MSGRSSSITADTSATRSILGMSCRGPSTWSRNRTSLTPRQSQASRSSFSRTAPRVARVAAVASRIWPVSPRVAETTIASDPWAEYLANVPPTQKTSSSGWANTPSRRGRLTDHPDGSRCTTSRRNYSSTRRCGLDRRHDMALGHLAVSQPIEGGRPVARLAVSHQIVSRGLMADTMIEVAGVKKAFGTTKALCGVDLAADRAKVLGLLGPNGAGKTTLVRILATLLLTDESYARIAGLDVVRDADAVRPIIGLAGQYAAVDETLTGRENLELVGRLYHLGRPEVRRRADEVLERFSLTGAADRQVKTYSGGMRRRLDLGASLVANPPVLILDEPTTGLDPRSRVEMWGFIETLVADGTTILLTTQYLDEADRLAHRIAAT